MLAYILRRLTWLPVVLVVVSFVTFALGTYGPGDPVQVMMGKRSDPQTEARLRHELGLDRPFLVQYGDYIWKALHGDFGQSFQYRGQSVGTLIPTKVVVSAQLGLVAMLFAIVIGLPLGLLAAIKQGSWLDTTVVGFTLLGASLPAYILAPAILFLFAYNLHLIPSSGWGGIFDTRIIMPALVMGIPPIAGLTRLMRASTLDVIGQDYVRTAHSKGLQSRTILGHHIARNAILPLVTVIGLSMATLVEGAFITETFFGIPGIGKLAVDSLFARDYPVIMALTLLVGSAYVLANLAVDIAYSFFDPRITYA